MGTRYKVRPGRPASGSARACVPVSVSVQRRDLSISPLARGFIVATRLSFWILRKWFVIRFPISRSRSTLLYYPLTPARSPTPCIPASTVRLPPRPAPPRAAARGGCAQQHQQRPPLRRPTISRLFTVVCVPEPHSEVYATTVPPTRSSSLQSQLQSNIYAQPTRGGEGTCMRTSHAKATSRRARKQPASARSTASSAIRRVHGPAPNVSHAAAMLRRCRRDLGPMPAWIARPPEPRLAPRRLYARP